MLQFSICAQIIIALSIVFVWVGRFDNIEREFRQYGISDLLRNIVGATKIVLSTLLVTGIWYPALVLIPALLMALLMVGAQIAHIRAKNPWRKYVPSALLLLLCLFVAAVHSRITAI